MTGQGLSARLRAVAGMVRGKGPAADIGCDHAYVPIELVRAGQISFAVAADVRKGPLSIAEENIRACGMEDRITTRLSDGLSGFRKGEVSTVVIAGMGGRLISSILDSGREVLPGVDELILEPQSEPEAVRRMIATLRGRSGEVFGIEDEVMVFEDGHYYPVIRAVPCVTSGMMRPEEYLFGPVLLKKRDPVLYDYLLKRRSQLEGVAGKLHTRMNDTLTCRVSSRLDSVQSELYLIQTALSLYEQEGSME